MNNLKRIRKEHNLSQYELADMSGIERSLIAHIETNRVKMTYRVAIILANTLHCYPSELLGEDLIDIHGGFKESLILLCNSNRLRLQKQTDPSSLDEEQIILFNIIENLLCMNKNGLTKTLLMSNIYKEINND